MKQILEKRKVAEDEWKEYGADSIDVTKLDQCKHKIIQWTHKFIDTFNNIIDGKFSENKDQVTGGAAIKRIFEATFERQIREKNVFADRSDADVIQIIRNTRGLSAGLSVNDEAMKALLHDPILSLQVPAAACVDLVFETMQEIWEGINAVPELKRYNNLNVRVKELLCD